VAASPTASTASSTGAATSAGAASSAGAAGAAGVAGAAGAASSVAAASGAAAFLQLVLSKPLTTKAMTRMIINNTLIFFISILHL
jgi:hypothetical protein